MALQVDGFPPSVREDTKYGNKTTIEMTNQDQA